MSAKLRTAAIGLIVLVCGFAVWALADWLNDVRVGAESLGRMQAELGHATSAIQALTDEQARTQELMRGWLEDREKLDALRMQLDVAVQEAMRNDKDYAAWRTSALPDRLLRLDLFGGLRAAPGSRTAASPAGDTAYAP